MRTDILQDPRSARLDESAGTRSSSNRRDPLVARPRQSNRQSPSAQPATQSASSMAIPARTWHSIVPHKSGKADHRLNYRIKVELGLIASLLVLAGLTSSPLYPREKSSNYVVQTQQTIQIEDVTQTKQELPPPPPPRPPVPIEVANTTILEDDALNLDATLDISEPVAELPLPPPPPEEEPEPEEPEIFVIVEQMPEMIGGIEALMQEITYPPLARQAGVEGRVIVQLVVDGKGTPKDPVVLRGIGGGCDEEAVRAVMKMKFKPGMQRGRPVPVRYSVSVLFKLKEVKR